MAISSCIDPFDPKITPMETEYPLVVVGQVTNEVKRHQIQLNRAGDINRSTGFQPEAGALVEIVDSDSVCYQLFESSTGVFYTDTVEFIGVVGKSYQLRIQLNNGEEFKSSFQEMKPAIPFAAIQIRAEGNTFLSGGVIAKSEILNIYEETVISNEPEYTRYEYEGTFAFESAYQGSTFCKEGTIGEVPTKPENLVCYRNQQNEQPLNVFTTENLASGQTFKQNILSIIPNRTFAIGYSMLIKKYTLTADFYHYLDEIRRQNEYGGSLFDPPPTPIEGNVENVNQPDKKALGFFNTSTIKTERIFIDNLVFSQSIRDPLNTENCYYWTEDTSRALLLPSDFCCDCRLFPGATDVKPEFWPAVNY